MWKALALRDHAHKDQWRRDWVGLMLYSSKYNFIYLKTRKTGGTSVEVALEPLCAASSHVPEHVTMGLVTDYGIIGARGKQNAQARPKWRNHMLATEVLEGIGQRTWDNCRRVACVRNPFDKTISNFWFLRRGMPVLPRDQVIPSFRAHVAKRWGTANKPRSNGEKGICFIQDQNILTDIIRYESLEADTHAFVERIGAQLLKGQFPQLKTEFRRDDPFPVSAYFDASTTDLIVNAFDWMFTLGDYSRNPEDAAFSVLSKNLGQGAKASDPDQNNSAQRTG